MGNAFAIDLSPIAVVPHSWVRRPAWSVVSRREVLGRPDLPLLSVYRDHGVVLKSTRTDNFNKPGEDLGAYKHVRQGDLVLNKMKTWQGSLAVSHNEGIVSPAYFVCSLSPTLHPRFVHYLLRSTPYIHFYRSLSKGIRPSQWDLPFEEFRELPLVYPSWQEQAQIARFLDEQDRRVNAALAARIRHLELLEERLNSFLVGSFLCPAEGSRRTRLKYLFSGMRAGVWGEDPVGDRGDVRCVRVADFQRRQYRAELEVPTIRNVSPQVLVNRLLRPGDILLERSGGGDQSPVGFAVNYEGSGDAVCSNFVTALRTREAMDPRYVCLLLGALYRSGRSAAHVKRTTGIQNLDMDSFFAQSVYVHPILRQPRMAQVFDRELAVDASVRAAFTRQAELVNERRNATIAAAVTGQIDVTTARGVEV